MESELKRTDTEILELFYNLENRSDVANILEIDLKTLIYVLYRTDNKIKYKKFTIKKRDGTSRIIKAPVGSLKIIQSKLNKILQVVYKEKGRPNAHGFIDGKSILTNAKPHVGKKHIFNVDLEKFFPTINFGRVRGLFHKVFQIGIEAATTLAQISCYDDLPQGSPCSPIISNLICRGLDASLFNLSRKHGCQYTRYADDLTFSSNKMFFPKEIGFIDDNGEPHIGIQLDRIISNNGFNVNRQKVRLANQFEHQEVTGLVVNEKINVRYSYIKNLRSMLYKSAHNGIYNAAIEYIDKFAINVPLRILKARNKEQTETIEKWFIKVLWGKLLYLKMVRGNEDLVFLRYADMFNELIGEEFFEVDKYRDINKWLRKRVVVVGDISKGAHRGPGSGFFLEGYGLVTCHHVVEGKDDNVLCYKAYNPYERSQLDMLSEMIVSDAGLDVAIYKMESMEYCFEIEKNPDYSIGQIVKLVGYPLYNEGNSIDIRETKIACVSQYLGQVLYVVDGNIFHGASGGPVLNKENKVIGIIRAGLESMRDDDWVTTIQRGFIPIDFIDELVQKHKDKQKAHG